MLLWHLAVKISKISLFLNNKINSLFNILHPIAASIVATGLPVVGYDLPRSAFLLPDDPCVVAGALLQQSYPDLNKIIRLFSSYLKPLNLQVLVHLGLVLFVNHLVLLLELI